MEFYHSPFNIIEKKPSIFFHAEAEAESPMIQVILIYMRAIPLDQILNFVTCSLTPRHKVHSHFNSAASLFTNIYLFICDLYYLKNVWVLLTFLRYFRVNMPSSVTVSTFFYLFFIRNPSIFSIFLSSLIMSYVLGS